MEEFSRFVEEHFPSFRSTTLRLDEPTPQNFPATTPAEHLYRYFRSGLAHGFCIEWGGLLHREDGAPDYLSVRNPIGTLRSLVIAPQDLIAEFEFAVDDFFRKAATWPTGSPQHECFNARFEAVFMICSGRVRDAIGRRNTLYTCQLYALKSYDTKERKLGPVPHSQPGSP